MPELTTSTPVSLSGGAVRTYLDISTAHVSRTVINNITAIPGRLADPTPYGAWVWVPSDIDERVDHTDGQIPQCLIDICRYAQALGCDHVHLDCDAEIIPELPTYDW